MQHVISYLHEDLSLPIYNKTAELSFEDVFCILTSNLKSQMKYLRTPFDVRETSSFIVDLTKLANIKDVTGNDGEKMEHHGQLLRQIVLKNDKITVRKRFSKSDSLSQEVDEIFYMYLDFSKRSHTPKVFQSVSSCTDALTNAIYKYKKPGDNFVKEVRRAPKAVAVFGIVTQFNDVMKFCAAPMQSQASTLGVDLTFNLGDFYITTTSYKNPMLLNKQGKHPIHIGPMQVSQSGLSLPRFWVFWRAISPFCGIKLSTVKQLGLKIMLINQNLYYLQPG